MRAMTHVRAERIERVIRHIDTHLDSQLTLARLSHVAGVSPFHFQRMFASATGLSPVRRALLLRLKRASMRLAFVPARPITDIALEAGFENAESFSRAFRRQFGQSPREFRRSPRWDSWFVRYRFQEQRVSGAMEVRIVDFPETKVAALEHHGPPELEYETVRKFIEWRLANRLPTDRHRTYGLHYTDPRTTAPAEHRVDICVSMEGEVAPNSQGVVMKTIQGGRYAVARHLGAREHIAAAGLLHDDWLPTSGESLRDSPIVFHYVNVGPDVPEHEMITDVYLPLR